MSSPTVRLPRYRSALFAPANQLEVLKKLPRSRPDLAILDLEDAVPDSAEAKQQARQVAREAQVWLAAHHPEQAVYLRLNAVQSPYFADDLDALTPTLAGVVLPKLERAADLAEAVEQFGARGLAHLQIMAGLETVAGVENAGELLQGPGKGPSKGPSKGAVKGAVTSAYFGAEDYVADLGGVRTAAGLEVLYPRSRVAMLARLFGVAAYDIVVTKLRDDAAFLEDARVGRSLGYGGKLCIHPAQVALSHQVFSPSPEEIKRAWALLAAYEQGQQQGRGVIAFEGQMVDAPMLVRARAVLASAEVEA
ncbi:CoA ester lyase [Deinococcus psychrotolerans]|uniref:CoA ester lyase n=1 Tax=Deinococcus psychrotolerans TaxID=2489213 RepID=A0A3G8YM19_9DEIO|nr:CoA ester lyase [Deinococcus psychrotolerans]AZI43634.1 CoA ester lyase [Deinococcus psychrotolerans]